jgi:hypothetical protein
MFCDAWDARQPGKSRRSVTNGSRNYDEGKKLEKRVIWILNR